MTEFTGINLAELPFPGAVESLDFETIFSAMLADLQARDANFSALVESDPAYKILEVAAYRELLVRQRVNDGIKAVMLAYSTGSNLDQLGALFGVVRQTVTPEDNSTIPPTPAVMESDDRFRSRVQISLEGFSTAGPVGAYVFHTLDASPNVKDVSVVSPAPGVVDVYILSTDGDGTASDDLLNTVDARLNADEIRPLTDQVTIKRPTITSFNITATLHFSDGPDSQIVKDLATAAINQFIEDHKQIGGVIAISGIMAGLHQAGVDRVELVEPTGDIVLSNTESAHCAAITIT